MISKAATVLWRGSRLAVIALTGGALTACGQTGPLYLPDDPPAVVTPAVPAPTATDSEPRTP